MAQETNEKYTRTLPHNKALIVIGDDNVGKSSLFSKLEGIDESRTTRDEAILGCYVIDGNEEFVSLLRNFMNGKNFNDFTIVVALSMDEPWKLIENFEKWMGILENFIEEMAVPMEEMNEYRNYIVNKFKNYVEFEEVVGEPTSQTPINTNQTTLPGMSSTTAAILGRTTAQSQISINSEQEESLKEDNTIPDIPLTQGALVKNLGIQIEVVITKVDCMKSLEDDYKMNDEHFDYIQMYLRKLCLHYGAGLVYTSVKGDKNCQLLKRYLKHQIYGFPLQQTAFVIEKDCVFVPSGWDSEKRINTLQQNLIQVKPNDKFENIIPKPKSRKNQPAIETEIEDEQIFFAKVYSTLAKDGSFSTHSFNAISGDESVTNRLKNSTPRKPHVGSGRDYSSSNASSATNSVSQGQLPGSNNPATEGVLANFFNSLLKKPANLSAADLATKEKLEKMRQNDSTDGSCENSLSTTSKSQLNIETSQTQPSEASSNPIVQPPPPLPERNSKDEQNSSKNSAVNTTVTAD